MKKHLIVPLVAATALGFGALTASAQQIVQNGDFSANASSFSTYPHYSSANSNVAITGWTESSSGAEGIEIEGDNEPYSESIFGPSSYTPNVDAAQFAFIQDPNGSSVNNTLTQDLALTLGGIYNISFESATRSNTGGDPVVTVVSDTTGLTLATFQGGASPAAFSTTTGSFVADGNDTLVLESVDTTGMDMTVDFTDVSVTAAPEPSTYALMVAGLGSLLVMARLRRRQA